MHEPGSDETAKKLTHKEFFREFHLSVCHFIRSHSWAHCQDMPQTLLCCLSSPIYSPPLGFIWNLQHRDFSFWGNSCLLHGKEEKPWEYRLRLGWSSGDAQGFQHWQLNWLEKELKKTLYCRSQLCHLVLPGYFFCLLSFPVNKTAVSVP